VLLCPVLLYHARSDLRIVVNVAVISQVATFAPKFFWEMFSRVAYLYFLVQVIMAPTFAQP
jgi:hypothetical protein